METITETTVFPHVKFTNTDGKVFGMPRERIIHYETYWTRDADGNEVLHPDKTFVNFVSPNHKSKGNLHAVVDMPVEMFYNHVMRPAYEGRIQS